MARSIWHLTDPDLKIQDGIFVNQQLYWSEWSQYLHVRWSQLFKNI